MIISKPAITGMIDVNEITEIIVAHLKGMGYENARISYIVEAKNRDGDMLSQCPPHHVFGGASFTCESEDNPHTICKVTNLKCSQCKPCCEHKQEAKSNDS